MAARSRLCLKSRETCSAASWACCSRAQSRAISPTIFKSAALSASGRQSISFTLKGATFCHASTAASSRGERRSPLVCPSSSLAKSETRASPFCSRGNLGAPCKAIFSAAVSSCKKRPLSLSHRAAGNSSPEGRRLRKPMVFSRVRSMCRGMRMRAVPRLSVRAASVLRWGSSSSSSGASR